MARRGTPRTGLDFYPTPPWATRALIEHVRLGAGIRVLEPAAGAGSMVGPLAEAGCEVTASDIHDYGAGYPTSDFLSAPPPARRYDWMITNPPFRLGEAFALQGLHHADNAALLCRLAWLETKARWEHLWDKAPFAEVLVFTERVVLVKGRLPGPRDTTATAYAWFVFRRGHHGPPTVAWVPPGTKDRLSGPPQATLFKAHQ